MLHGHSALTTEGKFFRRGGERWLIKGVAYGPFEKALDGSNAIRRDLQQIRDWHFNSIRIYETPTSAFLKQCEMLRLDVFVSIPWESNTDFLGTAELQRQTSDRIAATVRSLADQPAVAGYFIGNEIPSTLVRWMGAQRVRKFLEGLIRRLRALDPLRLITYANYPSTEYLLPRNGDFTAFNVYLEEPASFDKYLAHLHHLAADRPLVVSEYGLDSVRNGRERQAEVLRWQTQAIFEGGAAGAFLFSYTDDWFNADRQMTDWGFGLVARDRSEKPAAISVADVLAHTKVPCVALTGTPKVSVIVCTHNGHRYLPACLASLAKVHYPNIEVLVIDDGSHGGLEQMVAKYPDMRYVRQDHAGLSVARNRGAAESSGDLLAYTDDDCVVDRDWVTHLVQGFEDPGIAACGGPNIAPASDTVMGHCVSLAPGNPSHVMIDDVHAEHLPGCNLAVRRCAFEAIGGFREHYQVAGDDVDFCWRLQFRGDQLGFAANAFVWHHRRLTWRAFAKQQIGYGKAEALLQWDHPQKFNGLGGTDWQGRVYSTLATRGDSYPIIYFGQFGTAPFQKVYSPRNQAASFFASLAISCHWMALITMAALLGFYHAMGWFIASMALMASLLSAALSAWKVCLPELKEPWCTRVYLAWLHWAPAAARSVVRWFCSGPRRWNRFLWQQREAFWSSNGVGRHVLLERLHERVPTGSQPWQLSANDWSPFDMILPSTPVAHLTLLTTTEPHRHQEHLSQVSIRGFLKPGARAVVYAMLVVVLGHLLAGQIREGGLWLLILAVLGGIAYGHTRWRLQHWMTHVKAEAEAVNLQSIAPE